MMLSAIIVNWNSGLLLRKCLEALSAAQAPHIITEVIVVDNASSDTSITEAQQSGQSFRLLALPKNVGFARANNLALKEARSDVLLFLNPDTELRPGGLSQLLAFFRTHPRAGIVGGKLLNPDGSLQPSVRRFPTALALALVLTRVARLLPRLRAVRSYEMADFRYDREAQVEQVMGACFAVRREVLSDIEAFDEGYWLWFEEVDYCLRARRAGWEVWFTPAVEALHHRAQAFRQVTPLKRAWWFSKSALRYALKHLGFWPAVGLALLVPVHLLTGVLASLTSPAPGVLSSSSR